MKMGLSKEKLIYMESSRSTDFISSYKSRRALRLSI